VNLLTTLRSLWRRWYIVVPGVLLAAGLAVGAWFAVPPGYERTASQLLLPGTQSIPSEANPFLYLGGLSNAADVVVRAVGSDNVISAVQKEYPDAEVEVTRDVTNSGPFILITVTASSDADAESVLDLMLAETAQVLSDLQNDERITAENRITVVPIAVDTESVLQQRERLIAVAAVAVVVLALTLLVAGLVDGLVIQRRRRPKGAGREDDGDVATPPTEEIEEPGAELSETEQESDFDPVESRSVGLGIFDTDDDETSSDADEPATVPPRRQR